MARVSEQPRRNLEVVQDWVEVSTALPQPDPRWTYTDQHDHHHAYGTTTEPYPTLIIRYGEPYWCDYCDDEHTDSWLECPLCGEKIRPRTFVDTGVQRLPGMKTYLLNGEPVSKEEGERILAEQRGAQAEERGGRERA